MRSSNFIQLDKRFLMRWSPRSFEPNPIDEKDLLSLFEAARWAPSCFNEQPWVFVYAKSEKDKINFQNILNEGNQIWAINAPVLVAVFSKRHFEKNGKENRWSDFDCGAAWMSITLQALSLGIYCHGMAGYDPQKAYATCNVDPLKFNSVCMIALGKIGPPEKLPEPVRSREFPSDRKELKKVVFEGSFTE